jgi:uncharacterized protein DUF885
MGIPMVRALVASSLLCLMALSAVVAEPQGGNGYSSLATLFQEWRAFQKPKVVAGVPDYTARAMKAQQGELPAFQRRLAAIDTKGWSIAQQVDHHIVRAEMNGLDFDHRVIRPWENDPAFYVTVFADESDQPAREGHYAYGSVELWKYKFPLDASSAAEIAAGLRAVPGLLDQAQRNLVGTSRDLWTFGARLVQEQREALEELIGRLNDPAVAAIRADAEKARAATDSFRTWVEREAASKTGRSGIGIENYDWYLKNVALLPYTWRDEVVLMERELGRSLSSLALEEQRNASLPPSAAISNAEEYARRAQAGVTDYIAFLRDRQIMTIRDYMDPALRERVGRYTPEPREFFTEVDHHDPQVMRTHGYHWFDKARMANDPHPSPIRRGPLLYNIFITRTEGHATGWEEMMLDAGMFDSRPRSRELIYILIAQRAARALGDLRMHANQATLEEAAAFTSAQVPRGWLSLKGNLVRSEQHLYLRQPAYGTSYLVGKIQIERLLADRKRQLGSGFTMKRFMDEFDAAGLIPISLIRWELTGELSPDLVPVLGGNTSRTRQ